LFIFSVFIFFVFPKIPKVLPFNSQKDKQLVLVFSFSQHYPKQTQTKLPISKKK